MIVVLREEYLDYVKDYKDKLEPEMESMVTDATWKRLERSVVPNYSFNKNGVLYVFEKL